MSEMTYIPHSMKSMNIVKPNVQKVILTIAGYITSLFLIAPLVAARAMASVAPKALLSVVINVLYYIIAFGYEMGNVLFASVDLTVLLIGRMLLQIIYVYIIVCIALKLFQKESKKK